MQKDNAFLNVDRVFWLIACTIVLFSMTAHADDAAPADNNSYVLSLKNHQFTPQELVIPANQKIKLTVKNLDSTPAEFESDDLKREKVVEGNSEITVALGPLDPGTYGYFDDYHEDTTKGTIKVK